MSWKPTIILLSLAVIGIIAAAYALRIDAGRGAAVSRAADASAPLPGSGDLPVDQVQRIELSRAGTDGFVFERRERGRWMQVEPFEHPMDRLAMRQLIAAATQVQVIDEIDPSRGQPEGGAALRVALGLDPPAAVLRLAWPDGQRTFHLGRTGIAGRAYLQVSGVRSRVSAPGAPLAELDTPIYVVSQHLHRRALEADPRDWRDRRLFPDLGPRVQRIAREAGRMSMSLAAQERRQWRMLDPAQTRVDAAALDEYINLLGGAVHGGFIADQPRDLRGFGLAPPVASLAIEDDGPARQRLLLGAPAGAGSQDRFAMIEGRPAVFRLPAMLVHGLFRDSREFIDPTGSGHVAADVKAVRINTAQSELRIERDVARWIAPGHEPAEVPGQYVQELLARLTELRGEAIQLHPWPQEMEVAVVTLIGFDERPLDTVRIAREPQSGHWMLENGDDVLRIFSPRLDMRLTPADFGL